MPQEWCVGDGTVHVLGVCMWLMVCDDDATVAACLCG